MRANTGVDKKALHRLFTSAGPVASVYVELAAPPEEDVWLRWQALTGRLAEQGADRATIESLTRRVSESVPGSGVLAAFAAHGEVLFALEMPGSDRPDLAVYDALPHVLPLLEWVQERPAYVLALVDRTGADVAAYPCGATEALVQVVDGTDDEIVRNAPGGWSQMRHQHRAEDSWEHNAVRVADALVRTVADLDARLLLLAGDVRALQYLTKHLPERVRREVSIRYVSGGRSPDGAEKDRAAQVAAETRRAADEQTRSLLHLLEERKGPSGRAVEGVQETLDALTQGRVYTLLVVDDPLDRRTAWFGRHPTQVSRDREDLADAGASEITRGPLIDVAVRCALLTGAGIHVVRAGAPDAPAEGIGALCRFAAVSAEQGA
ncbi:Vms1/Ankzf1 family peptidyl-tRNA hydrolase [Actinomadura formosensis]|uniref:baeRF2 domain-containing protein n=1 Tax=Actinomadura formosensis TaxID=60706 RepID=UPI003D912593